MNIEKTGSASSPFPWTAGKIQEVSISKETWEALQAGANVVKQGADEYCIYADEKKAYWIKKFPPAPGEQSPNVAALLVDGNQVFVQRGKPCCRVRHLDAFEEEKEIVVYDREAGFVLNTQTLTTCRLDQRFTGSGEGTIKGKIQTFSLEGQLYFSIPAKSNQGKGEKKCS